MRSTVSIGLLTAFSSAAFGQTESDVAHILKEVAETYRATKEYVLEADATGRGNSGHVRLEFKPPNRYRMEGIGFGDDPAFAEGIIVDDGSTVWTASRRNTGIAGTKANCFVLQVPLHRDAAVYTWWVDKKNNRILREDHDSSSSVFTTIKLNEPIPDSLFMFTPPASAKKIERQP